MIKGGAGDLATRIARMRADADRAMKGLAPGEVPSMMELREALDKAASAALEPDAPTPRYLSAVRNRIEVERLSREGVKVAEIARRVGISARYVVELRAELGVGRRR